MTTIALLLKKLSKVYGESFHIRYLHPSLYALCIDETFSGMDAEERRTAVCNKIAVPIGHLETLGALTSFTLCPVTKQEFESEYSFLAHGEPPLHWLPYFSPVDVEVLTATQDGSGLVAPTVPAIHFYGFKGGQARSTVLALLAKHLAEQGHRVLIVDADLEAPSLDVLFEVAADTPESTLLGLCGWSSEIRPLANVYVGRKGTGKIDLMPSRPRVSDYDMDFAAFLLGSALDPRTLEKAIQRLRRHISQNGKSQSYDVVLFDHRTGFGPSVLPITAGWPGPVALFVRPDTMMRQPERILFSTLLKLSSDVPGAFVTFSLDPEDSRQKLRTRNGRFVEDLLTLVADAIHANGRQPDDDEVIDPADLEAYWVTWFHDRALLTSKLADVSSLQRDNRAALVQLCDLFGLNELSQPILDHPTAALSKSGATDEGWFISTPEIARLLTPDSSFLYVFGRKGTGKTRVLRELQTLDLGEPLIVASDYLAGGIRSGSATFERVLKLCNGDYNQFWWTAIHSALEVPTTNGSGLDTRVSELSSKMMEDGYGTSFAVQEFARQLKGRRTFLIDGVETAAKADSLRACVEALFRVLGEVQFSPALSTRLTIRLFLRSDLARAAVQNVEQQTEGRMLELRWDKTSVLHFALGRIASLEWFLSEFQETCDEISSLADQISRVALSDGECERLLLEIFPLSLERNRLKTTTFLSTYFSDAGGEDETRASFYPRLFDAFLREIDLRARNPRPGTKIVEGHRISSRLVLDAYDEASRRFINEVRQELYTLLELDKSGNRDAVDKLMESFSGLKTPFQLEELVSNLSAKTSIASERIREALRNMKELGLFEERPGYPGHWRTGRLYKAGLNMKYVR